eukprot:CAMPEP_0114128234 /NCGR_PEP_ID=MMETSP0043_2-20121206/10820_1 /TAXON_ID=464988 /ORGANISM="Hemiselmis andersenii, Strain CCMP644" /LENGTH=411 /DNA_ID=CAMNT_0001221403 /DNA_START=206 /DNA_END=1441 /DNA_ORIENTATION=-
MQILVVDCFGKGRDSRDRFDIFLSGIQSAFTELWPFDKHVVVRKYDDLGEYLFQNESGLVRVEPLQRFDKLDFLMIDGDLPLRPWSHQSAQLYKLLVMCIQTGKSVFACSSAAALSLCAINNRGQREDIPPLIHLFPEGGTVQDIRRLPVDLDSMFLDRDSGDCYEYDVFKRKWRLTFNCGVRRRRNQPNHRRILHPWSCPRTRVPDETRVLTKPLPWEVTAAVTRDRFDHYAFKGLKTHEDMIMGTLCTKWALGEKCLSDKVSVLMDSAEGVELFEYGHILALQPTASAHPSTKPHSLKILRNFIKEKSQLMQMFDKLDFHSQIVQKMGEGSAQEIINRMRPHSASIAAKLKQQQKEASLHPPPGVASLALGRTTYVPSASGGKFAPAPPPGGSQSAREPVGEVTGRGFL